MAKYLVKKKCKWNRRLWDPESRLEKDRVYVGEEAPPEALFKKLGKNEEVPDLGEEGNKPISFSQLNKAKAGTSPEAAAEAAEMTPFVPDALD